MRILVCQADRSDLPCPSFSLVRNPTRVARVSAARCGLVSVRRPQRQQQRRVVPELAPLPGPRAPRHALKTAFFARPARVRHTRPEASARSAAHIHMTKSRRRQLTRRAANIYPRLPPKQGLELGDEVAPRSACGPPRRTTPHSVASCGRAARRSARRAQPSLDGTKHAYEAHPRGHSSRAPMKTDQILALPDSSLRSPRLALSTVVGSRPNKCSLARGQPIKWPRATLRALYAPSVLYQASIPRLPLGAAAPAVVSGTKEDPAPAPPQALRSRALPLERPAGAPAAVGDGAGEMSI